MCDCPTAGVFTAHETRRSWIIYKETKTEKGTTNMVQAGTQSSSEDSKEDLDPENVQQLLNPEICPPSPDPEDSRSQAIFKSHIKLGQEYLKVQTGIVYMTQKLQRLQEAESTEMQKQRQRIEHMQNEKKSLMLLKESLTEQHQTISRMNANQSNNRRASGGWVFVASDNEDN